MYFLYKSLTCLAAPFLRHHLQKRHHSGKETPRSLEEKQAFISQERPSGALFWIHAASIGEAQSSLILLKSLHEKFPETSFLVTTGTITSAQFLAGKLPNNAQHHYLPLDHPQWTNRFLDHWKPQAAFWMESELWPNMLMQLKERNIPHFLINAHMSEKSYQNWSKARSLITPLLKNFTAIYCQTSADRQRYASLSQRTDILETDNIKYCAAPLEFNQEDYDALKQAVGDRRTWLYASSHADEELLATEVHENLTKEIPDLLTIIVPRHPERRQEIMDKCSSVQAHITLRGEDKALPNEKTQIYVADTLGELGLFYKFNPIACIGRSFSNDGGGGHNPIEAAQHNCAPIFGPHVQNLQDIFDDFTTNHAALRVATKEELENAVRHYLLDTEACAAFQKRAQNVANKKTDIINTLMDDLYPKL